MKSIPGRSDLSTLLHNICTYDMTGSGCFDLSWVYFIFVRPRIGIRGSTG